MKRWAVAGMLGIVMAAAVLGARADETVWLSSLDLSKATQGFGKPQADKSVDGHPLTLQGQTFAHGFGTHSPGLLAIDLVDGTKRFTATVGIDDEVGSGKGSAEFEVLNEKHDVLWRSGVLRQGQAPKKVDLDLSGAKQILLRVTTGGDGFEFDHADWADAQFQVTGARPQTVAFQPIETVPVIDMTPAPAAPQIHPPLTVGVWPAAPFVWTVPVTGARPLAFTMQGLPKGVSLNAATGTLSGAVAAGSYPIRLSVKNGAGQAQATVFLVAGDRIARTPPMGWNSYDAYGDQVDEAQVMANARYLRENMQPVGWDTVVIDYRWYDPNARQNPDNGREGESLEMDKFGRLGPAPDRFPSAAGGKGFKGLADQLHAMGLKFGIHIMRGIPRNAVKANLPIDGAAFKCADAANTSDTCPWCADMYGVRGATPAGQAYYDSLFRLYASWGVDFVKMDDTSAPYHTDEIEAVRHAIDKCGRAIVYSLSPGETPVDQGVHVADHANQWRVSGDFWDSWTSLDHEFTLAARWQPFVGPGHWPDADMLPLGHISLGSRPVGADRRTNFTKPEQMTLMSLWALLPSPLMVGANLPDNDAWTLALLTNPDVLAVNQDTQGEAAKRVSGSDDGEVWSRRMVDGSVVVGLFNRGDFDQDVSIRLPDLGLSGRYQARDLWQRKELGSVDQAVTAHVPRHGAALIRLRRV